MNYEINQGMKATQDALETMFADMNGRYRTPDVAEAQAREVYAMIQQIVAAYAEQERALIESVECSGGRDGCGACPACD